MLFQPLFPPNLISRWMSYRRRSSRPSYCHHWRDEGPNMAPTVQRLLDLRWVKRFFSRRVSSWEHFIFSSHALWEAAATDTSKALRARCRLLDSPPAATLALCSESPLQQLSSYVQRAVWSSLWSMLTHFCLQTKTVLWDFIKTLPVFLLTWLGLLFIVSIAKLLSPLI